MTPDDDNSEVYRFFTEVGIINQLISAKLQALLPGRMTVTQFGIMGHLARRPEGETPLQLATAFQVPKTSMTHMLAGLHADALITLDPNPNDKRSKIARATDRGHVFLAENTVKVSDALKPVLSELGKEAFADTLPHLARIREVLDAERD